MTGSAAWIRHFRWNAAHPELLPWEATEGLAPEVVADLAPSIRLFQLGEGSDGAGLRRRAAESRLAREDPLFSTALVHFIGEEQRHSADLGRWLDKHGIPRLESQWADTLFRRLRALAGLELSVAVLVTAEIASVPFYRALGRATGSRLLEGLCGRILREESDHLHFEACTLARLRQGRSRLVRDLAIAAHWLFLCGTLLVVLRQNRRVFALAGWGLRDVYDAGLGAFADMAVCIEREIRLGREETVAVAVPS